MATPLTPGLAALAAQDVYALRATSQSDDISKAVSKHYHPEVQRAFAPNGSALMTGASGLGPISQKSGFGAFSMGVGTRKGEALLALRGTATGYDAGTDISASIAPGQGRTGVHSGFQQTFESFRAAIDAYMRSNSPSMVHVVGHSLGGALATIAAGHLAGRNTPVKLYTFGSPRVGLAGFARGVDRLVGAQNIYRCYHAADPVPMLPVFPFIHVCVSNGGFRLPSPGDVCDVGQHLMDSYLPDVRTKGWNELRRARNPFSSLTAAQAWLERAASSVFHIPVLSSRAIAGVGQALNLLVQAIAGVELGAMIVAETAVDWLAQLLARGAALGARLGRLVRNALIVCMKIAGLSVSLFEDGAELVAKFVRWILQSFFNAIASKAGQALQVVRG